MTTYQFLSGLKRGKALSHNGNLTAYVMDVDAEIAEKLLALNFEHNRNLRNPVVKRFSAMVEKDEFVDGSPIRLAECNGAYVLTDGQHRLRAIIDSGECRTMVIIVSHMASAVEVREEYAKLDSGGTKRSLADVASALDVGEELPTGETLREYTAAARMIASNFNARRFEVQSRLDIYPVLMSFRDAIYSTREWLGGGSTIGKTRGFMRAGVLAIAMITAQHADEDKARAFWSGAREDDGLRKYDPRKKLHDYLIAPQLGGGSRQIVSALVAAKCWNSFVAGEEIMQLKLPATMPAIALTPYPLKDEAEEPAI